MKFPVALLLCTGCVFGQIRLFVVENGVMEREVKGAVLDLGSAGPRDVMQTRFRVYNIGAAAVQVRDVRAEGQGFSLNRPSLPYILAGNGPPMDFTVTFSDPGTGGFSANLTVDSISVMLLATVVNAAVLVNEGNVVAAGTAISLGRIQKGQRATKTLILENRADAPINVRVVSLTGSSAFAYRGVYLPLEITPHGSHSFEIEFAPPLGQRYTGTLNVDGRVFPLTGDGFDPPLPKPSIIIDGDPLRDRQLRLSIRLASPAETIVNGTLRLDFRPSPNLPPNIADDAAIRLMLSGGRNVNVQTRLTDDRVWIANAASEAVFQTGSTAGVITWTLDLGPHQEVQTVMLPAAPATVESATAARRTQDLDVSIAGFDNTRSMTQAWFTFFDTSGRPVSPGTIRADVRREFEQFFQGSTTGGMFSMRATFPVQGGAATQITGVEVEIVNSAGGTRIQRLDINP